MSSIMRPEEVYARHDVLARASLVTIREKEILEELFSDYSEALYREMERDDEPGQHEREWHSMALWRGFTVKAIPKSETKMRRDILFEDIDEPFEIRFNGIFTGTQKIDIESIHTIVVIDPREKERFDVPTQYLLYWFENPRIKQYPANNKWRVGVAARNYDEKKTVVIYSLNEKSYLLLED